MATELKPTSAVALTRYAGKRGCNADGTCASLQLTQGMQYLQLTMDEARELRDALTECLADQRPEERAWAAE